MLLSSRLARNVYITAAHVVLILCGKSREAFTGTSSMGGQHNIRVNCVRPGQILTQGQPGREHTIQAIFDLARYLRGRVIGDVANLVLFCAETRFITGES